MLKVSSRISVLAGLIIFLSVSVLYGSPQASLFVPISPENASQVQLINTLENYHEINNYCACNERFFSSNGRTLATDWKVEDLASGTVLDFKDKGYPLALSADGLQVIVSGQNAGTRLVDVTSGKEQMLMTDDAEIATFSPDGALFLLSSRDADAIQLWDTAQHTVITTLGKSKPYLDNVTFQFTKDGSKLIWGDNYSLIRILDVKSQKETLQIPDASEYILSSDETTLVMRNSRGSAVEVWDIASGKQLSQITDTKEQSGVNTFAISPDKRTLAIRYYGGNARTELWNIATQPEQLIGQFDDNQEPGFQFTPDSQYLILSGIHSSYPCDRESRSCSSGSGGSSEDIKIISAETGKVVTKTKPKDKTLIWNTVLSPDSHLLLTTAYFGETQLWHLEGEKLEPLATFNGDNFLLSPDGSTLLTELGENFIAIYGIATAERPIKQYIYPAQIASSVVNVRAEPNAKSAIIGKVSGDVRVQGRSPDGQYVYLPDSKGWVRSDPTYIHLAYDLAAQTLNVVDNAALTAMVASPTPIPTLTPTLTPTPSAVSSLSSLKIDIHEPIIAPVKPLDGLTSITPENSNAVSLLAVLPDSFLRADTFPLVVPAISRDGSYFITPPTKNTDYARIWNLYDFTRTNGPQKSGEYYDTVMVVSSDGKHVAYSTDKYGQPLWLWSNDHPDGQKLLDSVALFGIGRTMTFSPDGKSLAYPGGIIDVPTLKVRTLLDDSGSFAFSPKSDQLAIITRERIYFYDAQTGELSAKTPRLESSRDWFSSGKFSADGSLFVGVIDTALNVYNTQSGDLLYTVSNGQYDSNWGIDNIAFSPDAQTLAVLNLKGSLSLYTASTGKLIGIFDVGLAKGIAFSPDGNLLAIGNPLRLINLANGSVTPVEGSYGGSDLTFTPDGSILLVDSADNTYNDFQSVMVFGIPVSNRPAWQEITAHVIPAGINVRAEPSADGQIIGSASSDVKVIARDEAGEAVYLAEPEGWVWSAAEYLSLDRSMLLSLPVRTSDVLK